MKDAQRRVFRVDGKVYSVLRFPCGLQIVHRVFHRVGEPVQRQIFEDAHPHAWGVATRAMDKLLQDEQVTA